MSEISYSKKLLGPLITKYAINVEKNTLFNDIIDLFNGCPNYHVWAVKSIFSKATTFDTLKLIKAWSDANPNSIRMLSKNGNITSYSSEADFNQLLNEMHNIDRMNLVNQVASTFNTEQKKIIINASQLNEVNSLNADKNSAFMEWFELLRKYRKIHADKRKKTTSLLSAVKDADNLKRLIKDALVEKYVWDKEDMLSFVSNNTPDVRVVYNVGPIVILDIPSFKDSKTICYNRTKWCITRDESQFKNYVLNHPGNHQYFFFDFSLKETEELAHVGFTVSPKEGFTAAHSTSNESMLGSGIHIKGEYWNIQKLLTKNNISMGTFMDLKKMNGWEWNVESLIKYAKNHKYDIVCHKDNVIVLRISNSNALKALVSFSFTPIDRFPFGDGIETYVVMNFNVSATDDSSIYTLSYQKDRYRFMSIRTAYNTYGSDVLKENFLSKLGISSDDFVKREAIDPNILLHKYIDEMEEDAAIRTIEENYDTINVNYKLDDRIPVFSSIENGMYRAFASIVNHKSFNGDFDDGGGANILQVIVWSHYNTPEFKKDSTVDDLMMNLIQSGKFDLNYTDYNDDTLLSISALNTNANWLVEYLVSRPDVNINLVNDLGYTAFGNAIRYNNLEAAKIIGSRSDIKLSERDSEIIKSKKINLKEFLVPSDRVQTSNATSGAKFETNADYAEVLSRLFGQPKANH